MIKKILITFFFLSMLLSPLVAQDYEELLTKYETLLISCKEQNDSYNELIEDYKILNEQYREEIEFHQASKDQLNTDKKVLELSRDSINDLLKIVDPRYFTIFVIGGYQGNLPLGELAISASIPKLPFSVFAGVEYIYTVGVNMKLGVGVKF